MHRFVRSIAIVLAVASLVPGVGRTQQVCVRGAACSAPRPCSAGDKACLITGSTIARVTQQQPQPQRPTLVTPRIPPPGSSVVYRSPLATRTTTSQRVNGVNPLFGAGYPFVPVYNVPAYPYAYPYAYNGGGYPPVNNTVVVAPNYTIVVSPEFPMQSIDYLSRGTALYSEPVGVTTDSAGVPDTIKVIRAHTNIAIVPRASVADRAVYQRIINDLCGDVLYADCSVMFWSSAKDAPTDLPAAAEQIKMQVAEYRMSGTTGARTFYFMKDGKPIVP
jgi:hypothetical protein